jgi:hypothetical protein
VAHSIVERERTAPHITPGTWHSSPKWKSPPRAWRILLYSLRGGVRAKCTLWFSRDRVFYRVKKTTMADSRFTISGSSNTLIIQYAVTYNIQFTSHLNFRIKNNKHRWIIDWLTSCSMPTGLPLFLALWQCRSSIVVSFCRPWHIESIWFIMMP